MQTPEALALMDQIAEVAKPVLVLSGRSHEIARARGADHVLLALTHDGDYAIAQAMLVGKGEPADGGLGPSA